MYLQFYINDNGDKVYTTKKESPIGKATESAHPGEQEIKHVGDMVLCQLQLSIMSLASTSRVLYSFWLSPCSWHVRFALNLKGLQYEYKAVDLIKGEQFNPEVEDRSHREM
ncbi:probable maleylacetoacetate isomerase 1 [Chenopodium quinoa]|uniref:probable maleylacetoacetate isomerase 1 n=1 Tax=Chenopodium quinoa TaxID=63459 RepID=UPI000B779BCB|nr:probable maleylacetoacetate isomerase 1 [Chenopodium quinoa]XP_021759531.1 probable maleylacetoacetate isomerase 1 [Chenopodium quinoa]